MNSRAHPAFMRFSRLLIAALLATCFSIVPSLVTQPETREATYSRAVAQAHQQATRVGLATLGNVYLSAVGEVDETAIARSSTLNALDKGLDPASPSGGLFPLRKAMEQLAAFLVWPIVIISILHALIVHRGSADQALIKIGVQFFVVMFMFWFYPFWDWILYNGISKPITAALTSGPVVQDILIKIGEVGGRVDLAQGTTSQWTPSDQLSAFYTNDAACAALSDVSGGNPAALQRCYGSEKPQALRAMHARSYDGYLQGSDEQKEAYFAKLDPSTGNTIASELEKTRGRSYNIRDPKVKSKPANLLTRPAEWLAEAFTGLLLQAQMLIANAVMWFVWLGVIAARAMSFTLAPLALVWGLVPGSGPEKARRWFTGHAKITLMPIGLSFGILVFFAIQTAIFATPIMTNAVIGVGLKFALFFGLLTILFKSSTLTGIIAGDVTAVAADFGNAVRNRTIQLAAVAAGGAAVGTIGAGSAMMTTATGKGVAAKIAAAPRALTARIAQSRVAGGLAERLMGGKPGTFSQQKPASGITKALKMGWGALKDTGQATAYGVKSGLGSAMHIGQRSGLTDPSIASVGRALVSEMADLKRRIQTMRPERGQTLAATNDATFAALSEIPNEIRERRRTLRQLGLPQRSLAQDDIAALVQQASFDDIQIGTSGIRATRAVNRMATLAIDNLVAQGIAVNVRANKDGTLVLDNDTEAAIKLQMEKDPKFAAAIMEEAKRTFGSDNVPTVMGRSGPLPDVAKLMTHSTTFANAMAVAAQVWERIDREAFRRTLVAHAAGSQPDSLHEHALGSLHPEIARKFEEEDGLQYANRLNQEATRLLRMAWYIQASPEIRAEMGLPRTNGHFSAMLNSKIDEAIANWFSSGSATDAPQIRDAIRQAATLHASQINMLRQRRVTHGGKEYGVQLDDFILKGVERYRAEAGSIFHEITQRDPALAQDHAKAYKQALAEAVRQYADRLPARKDNESDGAYLARLKREANAQLNAAIFLSAASLERWGN